MARILAEFAACVVACAAYWVLLYGWMLPSTALVMGKGLPHFICAVVLHGPALLLLIMAVIAAFEAVSHRLGR